METVIDWNKAPDEATHGRVTISGVDFYMRSLGEWVYFNSRGMWERAYGTSEANCEERPQWTGKGLPPVGTVCESGTCHHMALSGEMSTTPDTWERVTILAHGICADVGIAFAQGNNSVHIGRSTDFRPIRTPEQIAADERKAEIDALIDVLRTIKTSYYPEVAEAILKAGYRKQVAP